MKLKYFMAVALVIAALTFILSGCDSGELDLEGKTVVTFQLGGGTLNYGTSSTNTYIKYAYEPGTYLVDPSSFSGYALTRNGYRFTGWYTDEKCQNEWNFSTGVASGESMTLYAGWELNKIFSYSVYYVEGSERFLLGSYEVNSGEEFEDWKKFADSRQNYTKMGYYSDITLTTPWDFSTTHPGGDADLDIPVYVDYMEGTWVLVSTLDQFKSAIRADENVYLMNSIDCQGAELSLGSYNAHLKGNDYVVSNFNVNKSGGNFIPKCAIFDTLGENSVVENVSFIGVTYHFNDVSSNAQTIKVAALAVSSNGAATVTNVTVEGVIDTNYDGALTKLNSAFFEEKNGNAAVSGFNAEILYAAD